MSSNKTEIIRQDYEYTFLCDLFEMIRGTCCIINIDKTLDRLFTDMTNYLNTRIPLIEDEITDFSIAVTVKKD